MSKGHFFGNNNCSLTLQGIHYAFKSLHGSYNVPKWTYTYKELQYHKNSKSNYNCLKNLT